MTGEELTRLDHPQERDRLDPAGTWRVIANLADQIREAQKIVAQVDLPFLKGVKAVILAGMGGSAIGGDLLRGLIQDVLPVPFVVSREYGLPAWVDEHTLVLASSYSGNTAETLSAYRAAKTKKARIITISSGGKLADLAKENGDPHIRIPGGISPRAAIGYSFFPLWLIMQKIGLLPPDPEALAETADMLHRQAAVWGPEVPAAQNQAKQLAGELWGRFPLIYGGQGWRAVVAYRWKTQINENAKNLAYSHALPELNHNETVGWENPSALTHQVMVLMLRDQGELEAVQRRFEITAEIIGDRARTIKQIWSQGRSELARMFYLIYLGDWISYYLALLNGVDPTPVKVIDYLKAKLEGQ